jgi:hypothetical protein
MTKSSIELTTAEKDMLVGGPHGDPYPVPSEADFDEGPAPGRLAADDLEAMARRLIAFDRLKIGYLADFAVRVIWMKAGGTSGGKPVFGTVQLASADDKFFASERDDDAEPFDAKVRLAADNLREAKATRWNVGYELAGLLCRIGLHVTQKTGDKRLVLVAPDASYSFAQMDVFGPQSPEIKRQFFEVKQQQFDWAQRLSEADFADDDEEEGDYDPSVDLPAGVDAEAGPVEGGAPAADWADGFDASEADFVRSAEEGPGAELAKMDDEDWQRAELVRTNFGTTTADDGSERCRFCGVDVNDHDPEVCAGGTPESRKRRSRKIPHDFSQIAGGANGAGSEESGIIGEPALLGHRSDLSVVVPRSEGFPPTATENLPPSNGNGNHDKDDVAALIADPDKVMAKVAEVYDMKIAYVVPPGERIGTYQHPTSGEIYDTQHVESLYRRALAGRTVV